MSWYIGTKDGHQFCGSDTNWYSNYVRKDCIRKLVLNLSKLREVDEVWKLADHQWDHQWNGSYEQLKQIGKLMWKDGVLYV